ncbi:hypothetical protein [Ornithinimicrobium panacihumi]|uniref:hypothetical protein n=1 Tax=Ornithinimicrobium panacihumi TaxID=2008449 RepID=UPI003F893D8B
MKQLTSAIAVALVLAGCSSHEAGTSPSGGATSAPGATPSAPATPGAAPTTGPAPTPTVDSVVTTEDGKVVTVDEDGVTHVVDAGPMPKSLTREQWLAGHWRFDDPPPRCLR